PRADSDCFIGTHQVHISRLGYLREFVHHHRNGRLLAQSDSRLQDFRLRFPSIPFLLLMPFLATPARLVFDRLSLEMLERLINRRNHVPSLSYSNQRSVAWIDRDLSLMAMFLYGQDDFAVEFIAQNFADFRKAGFNFFADGGSDFILPASVFHVHERPSVEVLTIGTRGPRWKF